MDRFKVLGLMIAAAASLIAFSSSAAQEGGQVALVVRLSDDQVETRCVAFEEDQITGYEALRRSGLQIDAGFNVQGGTICRIENVGCPAEDCFCQCQGGAECVYWSYWQQVNGEWQYASLGASTRLISDGDVEGWSWGPGTVAEATEPPNFSFEQVCNSTDGVAASSEIEKTSGDISWSRYLIFGGMLVLLLLLLLIGRSRRSVQ